MRTWFVDRGSASIIASFPQVRLRQFQPPERRQDALRTASFPPRRDIPDRPVYSAGDGALSGPLPISKAPLSNAAASR